MKTVLKTINDGKQVTIFIEYTTKIYENDLRVESNLIKFYLGSVIGTISIDYFNIEDTKYVVKILKETVHYENSKINRVRDIVNTINEDININK
jgi:hypothetical protein